MAAEDLSDDYVAQLLKQDAKETSARYSAAGIQAFLPQRSAPRVAKPNVKFLRNILRETDSHNAALLAREAEDSRARLKALQREESMAVRRGRADGPSQKVREEPEPKRRRVDKDKRRGKEHLEEVAKSHRSREYTSRSERRDREKTRRKDEDSSEESDDGCRSRRRRHESLKKKNRSVSAHSDDRTHSLRSDRRHRNEQHGRGESQDRVGRDKHRSHHPRYRLSKRYRSKERAGSVESEHGRSERALERRRQRSRRIASTEREQSGTDAKGNRSRHSPQSHNTSDAVAVPENRKVKLPSPRSDTDPLEAIIGPAPPPPEVKVRARGRGAFNTVSAMDAHFAANYDPSADVHPGSDVEDDWEQALEALRDRQRYRQQHADRLRAAGFTEDEVKKWEKGGEKNEDDVRWAKKGEGREWDRGKVVDEDGQVEVRAEWGRLKAN